MEFTSAALCAGTKDENSPLTVIHPVHEQSELLLPFMAALSLVHAAKGELEIVDVRRKNGNYESLSIRKVFEDWGILPRGSSREDVGRLNIKIKKIVKQGGSRKDLARRMKRHSHDICVVGIKRHKGIGSFFGHDLVEYLIQYFRQTTLYIPAGAKKTFVDARSGAVTLKKIIMPVSESPSPEPAFQILRRMLEIFSGQTPQVCGLHAGEVFPYISASSLEGLLWKEELSSVEIHHAIIAAATREDADLIVMSTNGRDTFAQKIIGSITERVLKDAPCPVLAVAVD